MNSMSQFLDRLERMRGLPVLVGIGFVVLNFVVQCLVYPILPDVKPGFFLYLLADSNLLLHLGVIIGLVGVLIGDIL